MPAPVTVVLPLLDGAGALPPTVDALLEAWPSDVEGRLVVPTRPLTQRDRRLLATLEGDVEVLEVDAPHATFGELAARAATASGGHLLLLTPGHRPAADDLAALLRAPLPHPVERAGVLALPSAALDAPVLSAALDLASLAALTCALHPADEPAPAPGPVLEPRFSWDGPAVPGLVSIVIPVWNQLDHTKRCLQSVRRSTRRPYEVVVVDNGSTDGTGPWLAQQRDVRVISNRVNLGFAQGCNQGVAAARGEFVVLLNNDTAVPRFWVEGLLKAFASSPDVAAVGPRSNSISGHQLVPDCEYTSVEEYRRFADAWRRDNAGRHSQERRLVGFCLALRRTALEQVGGLDEGYGRGNFEDDDLCLRLTRAGWTLLVAHEVLVHHSGSATFSASGTYVQAYRQALAHHRAKWAALEPGTDGRPLLSAALIVKDEQRSLPRCLASLQGVVDEVVVCDTGSSDRTVEIAEALGARVVHVPWQDDFAAARNAALEQARGEWVLSIDADETLVVQEATDLKVSLLMVEQDGVAVAIRSLGDTSETTHLACRLLRRDRLRWRGVLHETPVRRDGRPVQLATLTTVHLEHDGYVREVFVAKDKGRRNRAMARRNYAMSAVEDGGRLRWKGAYELARALTGQPGSEAEVEALLREAVPAVPEGAFHIRADALVRLAELLLRTGRASEAVTAARQAHDLLPHDARTAVTLAHAHRGAAEPAEGLAVLEAYRPTAESVGAVRELACEQVQLPTLHAELLLAQDRAEQALSVLQPVLAAHPQLFTGWQVLRSAVERRGGDDWAFELGQACAADAERALAAYSDALPDDAFARLCDGLRDRGVDVERHTPEARYRAQLLDALTGHTPGAVVAAARQLEGDGEPAHALALWEQLPATAAVQVARARCLAALDRVAEAAQALDGLQTGALDGPDLLVVAAVAAAAGDASTAVAVLQELPGEPHLAVEAVNLCRALGEDPAGLPPHLLAAAG